MPKPAGTLRTSIEGTFHWYISCYKVDSIASGRPFNVPLPVHFEVDLDGNVEFDVEQQVDLLPDELRSRVRQLTADRIGGLKAHSDHLKGFVSFFEDDLLSRCPSAMVLVIVFAAVVVAGIWGWRKK